MTAAAVALLLVGLALVVAATRVRRHGVLATLGLTAVAAGVALALPGWPGVGLLLALAIPVVAIVAASGLVVTRKALSAGRERARCGAEGLIGHVGVVRRAPVPVGQVAIAGELWRARQSWAAEDEPAPAEGEAVVVERVQGLTLFVRRAESWEVEP
jgi:membrane-bound ClpP family serine protease